VPYAKTLQIRSPKGLSGKLAYLSNSKHRNHKDKAIQPAVFHRIPNATAFLAKTVSTMRDLKTRQWRGRPIKNYADEVIIRLPDWSNPTAEERDQFIKSILADFCPDSPAVAVWHVDRFSKSADVHILVANFIDCYPPKIRRSAAFNPINLVRASSDRVTDIVNQRRGEQGVAPIVTMREVRQARLKERGIKSLSEQLAPLLPFPAAELREKIEQLGHKVSRHNLARDTISVRLDGSERAHRYSIDRLLKDASLGVNLAVKIVPPPVPKLPRPIPRPGDSEVGFE